MINALAGSAGTRGGLWTPKVGAATLKTGELDRDGWTWKEAYDLEKKTCTSFDCLQLNACNRSKNARQAIFMGWGIEITVS